MGLSKDQIARLEVLTEERGFVYRLAQFEGWKVFEEFADKTAVHAYAGMVNATDAATMGKQVGAYHVALSMKNFPTERLKQIDAEIKTLERAAALQQG